MNKINEYLSLLTLSPTNTLEEQKRNMFLLYIGILMSLGGLLWGTIALCFGLIYESMVPFSYVLITMINFFYMYKTKKFENSKSVQLFISLILPFIFQIIIGGFFTSGAIILWSILAIFGALTYKESASVRSWLFFFILLVIMSSIIDIQASHNAHNITPRLSALFFSINIVMVTSILFALFLHFVKSENYLKISLQKSLANLKRTQESLIETEKMASLGALVAGVAHEINTPIGVSVTAASLLQNSCHNFIKLYDSKELRQSDFDDFLALSNESTKIILENLQRAALLITSFKAISVDQSSGEVRKINLKEYIDSIILSLNNEIKKTKHSINVDCSADLVLNIQAGAFAQIFTNLIHNSLIHAFENIEFGHILIHIDYKNGILTIVYKDDGIGLTPKHKKKFFEPFFTTKRNEGGSGLGTHMIYNIVKHTFNGDIKLDSSENRGIKIIMTLMIKGVHDV